MESSSSVAFDDARTVDGLVPCIVQDASTLAVLMLGWMNREALELTRTTKVVHFWSRSRQQLWRKGETSGNQLAVTTISFDCDVDAILVQAVPAGPTCHTGETSCFFFADDGKLPTAHVLDDLSKIIAERKSAAAATSYTKSLLEAGIKKINAKIAEEQQELSVELAAQNKEKIVYEAGDLLFHVMVGLAASDVDPALVWQELRRRFAQSGIVEKQQRAKP